MSMTEHVPHILQWHGWFAWHPIKLAGGDRAWLRMVERRWLFNPGGHTSCYGHYQYRELPPKRREEEALFKLTSRAPWWMIGPILVYFSVVRSVAGETCNERIAVLIGAHMNHTQKQVELARWLGTPFGQRVDPAAATTVWNGAWFAGQRAGRRIAAELLTEDGVCPEPEELGGFVAIPAEKFEVAAAGVDKPLLRAAMTYAKKNLARHPDRPVRLTGTVRAEWLDPDGPQPFEALVQCEPVGDEYECVLVALE